jgi:short-subunit dehydrogenase
LVHNAGIGGMGLIRTWTDTEILERFAVNVFGPVRMRITILQLMLAAKGRIINIGSQGA